jgi:hypothetical protein
MSIVVYCSLERLDDPDRMAVFQRCKDDIQYTAWVSNKYSQSVSERSKLEYADFCPRSTQVNRIILDCSGQSNQGVISLISRSLRDIVGVWKSCFGLRDIQI